MTTSRQLTLKDFAKSISSQEASPVKTSALPEKEQELKEQEADYGSKCLESLKTSPPRYVLIENVPMLKRRGLDSVIKGLAKCGYIIEWDIISAQSVGAWHKRDRMFIVAYSRCDRGRSEHRIMETGEAWIESKGSSTIMAYQGDMANSQSNSQRFHRKSGVWSIEPSVGRMAYGAPARVERLRGLGNAVVPQVAEYIGKLIIDFDARVSS